MHPQPPHRKFVEDDDATQPAVEGEEEDTMGEEEETTPDEEEEVEERTATPPPEERRKSTPSDKKTRPGSRFPALDYFFNAKKFKRPNPNTPEGRDEGKRLIALWLETGKMPPELLKSWNSRGVKAHNHEEGKLYAKEGRDRIQVYQVSDKRQGTTKSCESGPDGREVNLQPPLQMFRDAGINVSFLEALVREQRRRAGMIKYHEDRTPQGVKSRLGYNQVRKLTSSQLEFAFPLTLHCCNARPSFFQARSEMEIRGRGSKPCVNNRSSHGRRRSSSNGQRRRRTGDARWQTRE